MRSIMLKANHPGRRTLTFLLASLGLCFQSAGLAQTATETQGESSANAKQSDETKFLRMTMKDGQPQSLQVAMTRYRPTDGSDVIVDLIGAVHIGEGDYYRRLNEQFELYDVVLYELVAPQGTRVPKGSKASSGNPLSMLQKSAQQMLGLESQLERVDYQKDNFEF